MLEFMKNGLLPPGDHEISLADLEKVISEGPGNGQTWDIPWRLQLLQEFKKRYQQLLAVGINEVYIDGSYATDKFHPNDMDVYFVVPRKTLFQNKLDNRLFDTFLFFFIFLSHFHTSHL
jgi:hypothetical protein